MPALGAFGLAETRAGLADGRPEFPVQQVVAAGLGQHAVVVRGGAGPPLEEVTVRRARTTKTNE